MATMQSLSVKGGRSWQDLWDSLELFAPAADPNDPASMAKARAWQDKYFGMTDPRVEQTRRPVAFNTGNPGGMVDPEALRVRAQGGPYDLEGTRNAIAAQLQANQAASGAGASGTGQGGGLIGMGLDPNPFASRPPGNAWANFGQTGGVGSVYQGPDPYGSDDPFAPGSGGS